MIPVATQLQRTPRGPASAAALRVSWCSAAFAAAYGPSFGFPMNAATEVTFTIEPQPRSIMPGSVLRAR